MYNFACDDPSGVASCPSPITVETEGADQSVTVSASDTFGNATDVTFSGINVDRTAPMLVVDAPSSVSPADHVTIDCSAADELSGIAESDCQPIQLDATTLEPGPNEFAFTATDAAGNTGVATITIDLVVDAGGIAELIASYLGDTPGAGGQLNALTHQLTNGDVAGFTNHVWAQCCSPQKSKRFTHDQATNLSMLVATLE